MEITRQRLITFILGGMGAATLLLYLVFYRPFLHDLKVHGSECRTVEEKVRQARELIQAYRGKVLKPLVTEGEISLAIEELTRRGNEKKINFVAMSPQPIKKSEKSGYKVLPIEMELEADYKSLGEFLGLLDELERSLVKVEALKIETKTGSDSLLSAKLTAYMILSESSHGHR